MPLVYFHLRDGVDILLDPEGRQMNLESIASVALHEARSIISADALSGRLMLDQHIDVVDESGALMHRIDFTDAVSLVLPPAD